MYIPLNVDLPDHPKTRRLRLRLHCDQGTAVGYLSCLWAWAFKYAPDGDLSRFDVEEIEDAAGWGGEPGKLFATLVDAHWIDGGRKPRLHDWADHSGKEVARRADARIRAKKSRERAGDTDDQDSSEQAPCADAAHTVDAPCAHGARSVDVPEEKEEERRGDKEEESANALSARVCANKVPDLFPDFWNPYPKKDSKAKAAEKFRGLSLVDRVKAIASVEVLTGWQDETGTETRFIPGACVWLNQRRFDLWWSSPPDGYRPDGNGNGKADIWAGVGSIPDEWKADDDQG